jgi:hypothetical protein
MKKSEMDELQILAASLRRHPTGVYMSQLSYLISLIHLK